ncbi:MAG: hypothetical protein FWB86_04415 [Treponema sp.]|nr:hypothetical protein [Treponema sp.]
MPKYTRMLCWVTPETKDKILEISENLPIVFTDNYEDFRKEINKDSYLAVSLSVAYNNLENFKLLLHDFTNQIRIIEDINDTIEFNTVATAIVTSYCDECKKYDNFIIEGLLKDFQKKV